MCVFQMCTYLKLYVLQISKIKINIANIPKSSVISLNVIYNVFSSYIVDGV